MSEGSDELKRWTARRKAAVVLDIIKGTTTAAETARSHDLTVAEESWMERFLNQGTEALRAKPRDVEAPHLAEKKELLAKIGELTMQKEIWKIAREHLGKPLTDPNS